MDFSTCVIWDGFYKSSNIYLFNKGNQVSQNQSWLGNNSAKCCMCAFEVEVFISCLLLNLLALADYRALSH